MNRTVRQSQPDHDQLRAIRAPVERAVLLQAGPGSGKTRCLIGRIAYLLHTEQATPAEIVAVTFTNRAAAELQSRVDDLLGDAAAEILVGTFHALALHILREHGESGGGALPFTVCDEPLQQQMIRRALEETGQSRYAPDFIIRGLAGWFSQCKRARHDPMDCPGNHPTPSSLQRFAAELPTIAAHYRRLLDQHHLLDFDDLILLASRTLYEAPEVGTAWHEAHPWLFVDEFHDIDEAQYQFVNLLAPPGTPTVMAVLDEHQRIYSWRGASRRLLIRFQRDYRPARYRLLNNYRSGSAIVGACDTVLPRDDQTAPHGDGPDHVETWWADDEEQEAGWIVDEITALQDDGVALDEIALLYRSHQTGEALEQRLVAANLPIDRIRRRSFFERREVQEIRRYLLATLKVADEHVAGALNFPRIVADELTMIQLRRLARRRGLTLVDLMRTLQASDEIGPATRRHLTSFLSLLERDLVPLVDQPLGIVTPRLFDILEQRRSPYPTSESETLRALVAFLDVAEEVDLLRRALAAGRPIQIVAADEVDGACAAALLAACLDRYFDRRVPVEAPGGSRLPGALRICCGLAETDALAIVRRDAGSAHYPAVLIAWQVASALLVALEPAPAGDVVVFDLETTGLDLRRDRPVEVAARRLRHLQPADRGFESLAQPGRPLSQGAIDVHGIFPEQLRHAPPVAQVMTALFNYMGDGVLVAHNAAFDLQILRHEAERCHLPPLRNPVVDTLDLARRLFPEAPGHSLEALVEQFRLPRGGFHRAMADVEHTVHLFQTLWQAHQQDQRLHLFIEALPLVGAVLAAEDNLRDENGMLFRAACRVLQRAPLDRDLPVWGASLPPRARRTVAACLTHMSSVDLSPTADDGAWQEIRNEWERYVRQFLRLGRRPTVRGFMDYSALLHREPDTLLDDERLNLMTIHAAKGKEFDTVFLVGLEDGVLPSYLARSPEDHEEERRVCYVGLSRAKRRLYALGAAERHGRARAPSLYWKELDALIHPDP